MTRRDEIQNAYHAIGKQGDFYDGMITCSTPIGKLICRAVWNMNETENTEYLERVFAGIPENFSGKLLEVPVGTGVLSMPVYETLKDADITCLDHSEAMLAKAKERAERMNLKQVSFVLGDVGRLPDPDNSFDIVLSLNGFHAFPDKEAAYQEVYRVLKPGGLFCGCFYIQGLDLKTDWIIKHLYEPKGYFTSPYETLHSLRSRLEKQYERATISHVKAMACFQCTK